MKQRRTEIVAHLLPMRNQSFIEIERYTKELKSALQVAIRKELQDGPIKDAIEYKELLKDMIKKVAELLDLVSAGKIDLKNIKIDHEPEEWRGADVIITSDFSGEISTKYIVVRTVNAKQVTWLMIQLRKLCSDYIDYLNKYEFYGTIAENAIAYIEKHGDKVTDKKMLIQNLLSRVIDFFNNKIIEIEEFIRRTENLSNV